jgi:predicted nucleic acid-binding protein
LAVVSNSSPLIAFAAIQQLSLFPALFESVLIPPAVALE